MGISFILQQDASWLNEGQQKHILKKKRVTGSVPAWWTLLPSPTRWALSAIYERKNMSLLVMYSIINNTTGKYCSEVFTLVVTRKFHATWELPYQWPHLGSPFTDDKASQYLWQTDINLYSETKLTWLFTNAIKKPDTLLVSGKVIGVLLSLVTKASEPTYHKSRRSSFTWINKKTANVDLTGKA